MPEDRQPIAPAPVPESKIRAVPKPLPPRHIEARSEPSLAATTIADRDDKDSAITLPVSEPMRETPAHTSAVTDSALPAAVTITGCLEISTDEDAFRLTDTEGADAPKSRSWRSGFLKKRSAAVALVEPPDRLALKTSIGKRVAATGLLTSHELKLNSLRVVGPSCN